MRMVSFTKTWTAARDLAAVSKLNFLVVFARRQSVSFRVGINLLDKQRVFTAPLVAAPLDLRRRRLGCFDAALLQIDLGHILARQRVLRRLCLTRRLRF